MIKKTANTNTKRTKNMDKYHEEGLIRLDLDLDYMTYRMLLELVERSGYMLPEADQTKSEKNEGFRGVITQAVKELYLKSKTYSDALFSKEINKNQQQNYIYSVRAKALRKSGFNDDEIAKKLIRKVPKNLSKKDLLTKCIRQKSFDDLFKQSEWSGFKFKKSEGVVRLELDRQGIRTLFVPDSVKKKKVRKNRNT
jgi:hypothetical protein